MVLSPSFLISSINVGKIKLRKNYVFRCFFIVGDEYDLWDRQDIFNQIKEGSLWEGHYEYEK
jgi:hypothetical protein